jgi:hypothetical protein
MTAVWLHQNTDLNYDGTCDYGNSNIEYMDPSKYLERKQGVDNSLQYRGARNRSETPAGRAIGEPSQRALLCGRQESATATIGQKELSLLAASQSSLLRITRACASATAADHANYLPKIMQDNFQIHISFCRKDQKCRWF